MQFAHASLHTETQTVVSVESREGEVQTFVLRGTCDREHVTAEFFDQDFDFLAMRFVHTEDVNDCIGYCSLQY